MGNTNKDYWDRRYASGGNSGAGSYGRLALFKSEVLNGFVAKHHIQSVIEFGCGDGHQLSLANYPIYVGFDVAPAAVQLCVSRFMKDPSKAFFLYDPLSFHDPIKLFLADMVMSLDVIFHILDDKVFEYYMRHLFGASERFVVVYSSNKNDGEGSASHVHHRRFSDWVECNACEWELIEVVRNKYPFDPGLPNETSFSDFYFYQKVR